MADAVRPPAPGGAGKVAAGMRDAHVRLVVLAVGAAAVLAGGCGGERQDADAPTGTFSLDVTDASFPAEQRVAEPSTMRLDVENTGDREVPDLAVTVETEPTTGGAAPVSFGTADDNPALAASARPVWIVDRAPAGRRVGLREHLDGRSARLGADPAGDVEAHRGPAGGLHRPAGGCRRRWRATRSSPTATRAASSRCGSTMRRCRRRWARTATWCAGTEVAPPANVNGWHRGGGSRPGPQNVDIAGRSGRRSTLWA